MCAVADALPSGGVSLTSPMLWPAPTIGDADAAESDVARRFVIACLAARRHSEELVTVRSLAPATPTGWQAVATVAGEEWVSPLLYRTVQDRDLVPTAIEKAWRGVYYESLRLAAFWYHELESLVAGLARAGVPVILLKGAALGERVYGNPALRPMMDLDLLVRQADVATALQALRDLGYTTDEPFGFFAEVVARKPGNPPRLVDLHWALNAMPHYQEAIAPDWIWQTARPSAVGQATAWVLAPEAQILHLCAHLVLQHREPGKRLLWLYDVAELLHYHDGEIDWPALLAAAERFDLILPLQTVLPCIVEAFAPPIPPAVLAQLTGLRPSRQELTIYRSFGAATWSPSQIGWLSLGTLPGWRSRLAYLWANLVPSTAYIRWRYNVRWPALVPVYYVRRWLEGLGGIVGLLPALLRRTPAR